jgi:hypothetical protein
MIGAVASLPTDNGPDLITVRRASRTYQRRRVPTALDRGEHGTAAYAQGCRCRWCKRARRLADRHRRAGNNAINGRPVIYRTTTTAMDVHVAELRRQGWTLARIAIAAGLNVEAFRRALRHGRTLNTTVRAVLAVR